MCLRRPGRPLRSSGRTASAANGGAGDPPSASLVRAGRVLLSGYAGGRNRSADLVHQISVIVVEFLVEGAAVRIAVPRDLVVLDFDKHARRIAVRIERPAEMDVMNRSAACANPGTLADIARCRRKVRVVVFRSVRVPGFHGMQDDLTVHDQGDLPKSDNR